MNRRIGRKGTSPSNIGSISSTIWLLYSRAYCISHITSFIPSTSTLTHTHTYDNIPYICRLIAVYDTIQYLTYIYINFNYLTIASMDFFLVTFNLFSLAKCELFRQDYKYLIFLIIIVQRTLAYDGNNNNNNGNNNCVK